MQNQSKNAASFEQYEELEKNNMLTREPFVKNQQILKAHKRDNSSLLLLEIKALKEENNHLKQINEINNRVLDLYERYTSAPELSVKPQGKILYLKVCR